MALPAILMAIGAPIAIGFAMSAAGPLRNYIIQAAFSLTPNEVIDVVNLINLRHRGIIDEARFYDEMQKSGYNSERSALLYSGSETMLNAYDIISSWRREAISEEDRNKQLKAIGFTDTRIQQMIRVSEVIPNARDIITFAVREVYSPEIATLFGQYEGATEVYTAARSDLQAAGMSEDTFKKYWAGHWNLPSATQGYEMMHRKIISEEELEKLMVALDVMPWWRDKLIKMSFNLLTRVDIRRMHKIGVIDDDKLTEAYEAIGYSPDDAVLMAQFTIIYNFGPEAAEMTPEDRMREDQKEASRASIVKAYKMYYLERTEALNYIEELGISPDAAELYITTADLEMEEDITNKQVDTVHDKYVRKIITRNDAVGSLGNLNLPARMQDALLANWDVELDARTSRPSKTELFKFWKLKLITDNQLKEELEGMMYPQKTIELYMRMLRAEL